MIGRKFNLKRDSLFENGKVISSETIHTVINHYRIFDEGEDSIYQVCEFNHNGQLFQVELVDIRFTDDKLSDKLARLQYKITGVN